MIRIVTGQGSAATISSEATKRNIKVYIVVLTLPRVNQTKQVWATGNFQVISRRSHMSHPESLLQYLSFLQKTLSFPLPFPYQYVFNFLGAMET